MKSWKGIHQVIKKNIKQGAMLREDHIWFPANFHDPERVYEVKARIRGDLQIHWKGKYQSWRVRFPKDDLFHGVKSLNLIIQS